MQGRSPIVRSKVGVRYRKPSLLAALLVHITVLRYVNKSEVNTSAAFFFFFFNASNCILQWCRVTLEIIRLQCV